MKILAIDTSTTHSSCSVMEDDYVVGDFSISQSMSHNEILINMIDEMLLKLNISINDIDLFVAVTGPGSFTGIRIGVTTIKALAFATNKPIVSVNTIEALCFGVFSSLKKVGIVDARSRRVYYGIYQGYENKEIKKPSLFTIDELLEYLKNQNEQFILVGDCLNLYKDEISVCKNLIPASASFNSCISRNALVIGKKKFKCNMLDDFFTLSPVYVRQSQAQRDFNERNKNC